MPTIDKHFSSMTVAYLARCWRRDVLFSEVLELGVEGCVQGVTCERCDALRLHFKQFLLLPCLERDGLIFGRWW
jgi:hypothetical protein